jgi:hypothetical protein
MNRMRLRMILHLSVIKTEGENLQGRKWVGKLARNKVRRSSKLYIILSFPVMTFFFCNSDYCDYQISLVITNKCLHQPNLNSKRKTKCTVLHNSHEQIRLHCISDVN